MNTQFSLPPEKEKPLPLKHNQVQMNLDAETMEQFHEVKALLSHKIPNGNLKEVFKYMLNLTTSTLKKRKDQGTPKERISNDKDTFANINIEGKKGSPILK